ncbi:hypothetical protein AAKU52_003363 [Pedobacter sp. CG_S7]|uniref:hypothetical protein n=1 Tax=Pedobacter sp. CG_S7 TaxID=3143930 RepID=UPI00339B8AEF
MNDEIINAEKVNGIIVHFVELKDDKYHLNIPAEKATELGISEEDLERVKADLKITNDIITEAKKDPNGELSLFDPKAVTLAGPSGPSGSLSSNGQEQVGTTFFAPSNTSFVRFNCRTAATPLPVYQCQTRALGVWITKTATGSLFTTTVIDVNIDASNYNVNVTFKTSDSNGGSCDWVAMS